MAKKPRIKKRKKFNENELSLFKYVFALEQKHSTFENCQIYLDWVFTSIKKYNTMEKKKFKDVYIRKYLGWKSIEER